MNTMVILYYTYYVYLKGTIVYFNYHMLFTENEATGDNMEINYDLDGQVGEEGRQEDASKHDPIGELMNITDFSKRRRGS